MERRCVICADPAKTDWVARRLMEGHSLSKIEEMSRVSPVVGVIKRETITSHKKVCLEAGDISQTKMAEVARVVTKGKEPADDVAVLVQREVVAKLKAGEARVTVQHGLQAQQLLDRRAERAKDRELAVTLARLLHTPPPPASAILERIEPGIIIEGEAVEI
jgi:hypothetical protein